MDIGLLHLGVFMKNCARCLIVGIAIIFAAGCSSTKAVGGAEMSQGSKGSRVGISNTGDGTEMYGSIRMGAKF